MTNNELLQQGIDLAKRGNIEQAAILFARVVTIDPKSELGWLWLGRCRTVIGEKIDCFNKVLAINPHNEEAERELVALKSLKVNSISSFLDQPEQSSTAAGQQSIPATDEVTSPKKKNWIRRGIYLLTGILVGIYLGRYIGNSLAATGFFDRIDNFIVLRTIEVPDFTGAPETPAQTEPTPSVSAAASYDKRLAQAWPLIMQANGLFNSQKYGDTVPVWNQALQIVPEYVDGYYRRGAAYFYLTQSQRAKSEYDFYLQLAIKDFDKAIELDPDVADYYIMRGRAYDSLAYQQAARVDFQRLERVAIENYQYSEKLPHQEVWNNLHTKLYLTMVKAGDCEKVIQNVGELINGQTNPAPGLHSVLADAHYCTGKLDKALEEKDEAIKLAPSSICLCERAYILYGLGRFDEAMETIEKSLSHQPYYGGDRYYFRALIYADRGNTEQAQKDIDFGMTQTWSRGGLLSYVQGKIALAQNRKEDALFYFQDAEATYLDEGPMLGQIRQDLIALGGTPRESQKTSFDITPVPFP